MEYRKEFTEKERLFFSTNGIFPVKVEKGVFVGVKRFMFSWGLVTHMDAHPLGDAFFHRFCYPNDKFSELSVIKIALNWDMKSLPPLEWVKYKGIKEYLKSEMNQSIWENLRELEPAYLTKSERKAPAFKRGDISEFSNI